MPNCLQSELTGGIYPGIISHYVSFRMQIAAADAQAFIWASSSALKYELLLFALLFLRECVDEHTLTRPDFAKLFQTPQTVGFN